MDIDNFLGLALILFFIKGYWAGDSKELSGIIISFLGLGISWYLAPSWAKNIQQENLPQEIVEIICFVAGAIIFTLLIYLISVFLTRKLHHFKKIGTTKRLLGGFFSVLRGVLLIVLLSIVLLRLPLSTDLKKHSSFFHFIANSIHLD